MLNVPPDQIAREKIETVLDINFLVEAGAGSGKTTSLVKRLVKLIESGRVGVAEIAAITFTRKAAAELRERFQTELESSYRQSPDPGLKRVLGQALQDIDQCYIGTIHSFCAKLLRERPVEAGLDPAFSELDNIQAQVLQQQAWDKYLWDVKLNRPELLHGLNEIGVSPLELKHNYIRLSCYPDVDVPYAAAAKPDLRPALAKVEAYTGRAMQAIPASPPAPDYDDLQKAVRRAARLLRYLDLNTDTNMVKVLGCFAAQKKVVQKRWNSTAEAVSFRDEFAELKQNAVDPALSLWREYCYYHLMRFTLPAANNLQQLRAKKSLLNFQDLLTKTAELLKNYPEVRQYFQRKYRCLLVDEFQDTDPIQAQIMLYLTGSDTRAGDWKKLIPAPGTLFVVGDPKQSIYRFRRADIDTYNLVRDIIKGNGGEILELTANFRSVSVLGDWFNSVFKGLFPAESSNYQAKFSSLNAMRPADPVTATAVKVLEVPPQYSKKTDVVAAEAESIASYISWAVAGNLLLDRTPNEIGAGMSAKAAPKDFMILLRYKDCINVYARALEKYGIPLTISGGGSLTESRELHELYKLLLALVDPANQVALAAVLRGLFCGISDAALYAFKRAKGPFCLLGTVPEELGGPVKDQFVEAFNRLKQYYDWSRDCAPTVALEKIILDLGLIPYALTGPMGKSRCAFIYQLLEYLRRAEAAGTMGFGQMVKQFGLMLEGDIEEELSIDGAEQDAVRLMNLHKAKGLEAPVVFLAHPAKKAAWPVDQHTRFTGDTPTGYFLFSKDSSGRKPEILGQPAGWASYEQEEQRYSAAEETRLLYVAATRAKNLLVISKGLKDTDMKNNPWAPLLRDIPPDWTLEKHSAAPVSPVAGKEEITPDHLASLKQQVSNRLNKLAKPTYLSLSPSGLKTESSASPSAGQRSGGAIWGTTIHRVFEHLVKGTRDLSGTVSLILQEQAEPQERLAEVLGAVKILQQTALWQRICAAAMRLTEVPFSLKIDRGHPLYRQVKPNGEAPIVFTGVIDLVFKEQAGWVIVDYKTDHCENDQAGEQLVEIYRDQVQTYCQVWEYLTNEHVQKGELYFASLGSSRVVWQHDHA